MADTVHHPFALGDKGKIEIGDRQPLTIRQGTCQIPALRADNSGVTPPLKRLVKTRL